MSMNNRIEMDPARTIAEVPLRSESANDIAGILPAATCRRAAHLAVARPRITLGHMLKVEDIVLDLDARDKVNAFEVIAETMGSRHGLVAQQICASLVEREELGSTGLGRGVAIPHARVKGLRQSAAAFARLRIPIAFDAPDAKPVSDMLVLLVPAQADDEHLKMLALVAEMFCDTNFRAPLRSTADPEEIHCLLTSWTPP